MNPRYFAIIGFILFGAMSRFMPHLPNFTAMNAIALMGAFTFLKTRQAIFTVIASMLLSDMVLGFHSTMLFVYIALTLNVFLGSFARNVMPLSLAAVVSSLSFFTITNFGVFVMSGIYEKSATGLLTCYVAALPFLSYQILADLTFTAILYLIVSFAVKNKSKELIYQ